MCLTLIAANVRETTIVSVSPILKHGTQRGTLSNCTTAHALARRLFVILQGSSSSSAAAAASLLRPGADREHAR